MQFVYTQIEAEQSQGYLPWQIDRFTGFIWFVRTKIRFLLLFFFVLVRTIGLKQQTQPYYVDK